jgi:hypothetical protein
MEINPRFKISQKIYHITPDSPMGVILNWRYCGLEKYFEYLVTFSPDNATIWYLENELLESKNFV